MSSTCFETEGSSSGRRLYVQLWYGIVCFTCIDISGLVDRRMCSSTYKTAYTDACKTYYTINVYTTEFLKMNPRVRNI